LSSQEENVASLQAWFDSYRRRGLEWSDELADQLLDPEIEFSPFLAREIEGRSYRGRDEVQKFFGELRDMLGDVRYDQPTYHPKGADVVVICTRLVGAGRGSAVPVGQDLGMVAEFHDGQVRRLTVYGSHEEALTAAEEVPRA
jgi:ketosteroid isomerase-like protein